MHRVCVKCAKCNPICPTFVQGYDELYSPRGYLHLCEKFKDQALPHEVREVLQTCTLCGLCEPLCPLDLPIVQLISEGLSRYQ